MNSLIDLTFLLLVTFILTIPALEQGISIMLPRAKTDTLPNKNNKANTITVSQTGTFFNNTPITLEALEQELLAKVKEDPDVPVLVRGDERLTYGAIMDVVKLVYKCKILFFIIMTIHNL
jgi:biopolymer transport protein ExbD